MNGILLFTLNAFNKYSLNKPTESHILFSHPKHRKLNIHYEKIVHTLRYTKTQYQSNHTHCFILYTLLSHGLCNSQPKSKRKTPTHSISALPPPILIQLSKIKRNPYSPHTIFTLLVCVCVCVPTQMACCCFSFVKHVEFDLYFANY